MNFLAMGESNTWFRATELQPYFAPKGKFIVVVTILYFLSKALLAYAGLFDDFGWKFFIEARGWMVSGSTASLIYFYYSYWQDKRRRSLKIGANST